MIDTRKAINLADLCPEELEPRLELQVLSFGTGGSADGSNGFVGTGGSADGSNGFVGTGGSADGSNGFFGTGGSADGSNG